MSEMILLVFSKELNFSKNLNILSITFFPPSVTFFQINYFTITQIIILTRNFRHLKYSCILTYNDSVVPIAVIFFLSILYNPFTGLVIRMFRVFSPLVLKVCFLRVKNGQLRDEGMSGIIWTISGGSNNFLVTALYQKKCSKIICYRPKGKFL